MNVFDQEDTRQRLHDFVGNLDDGKEYKIIRKGNILFIFDSHTGEVMFEGFAHHI